MKVCHWLLAAFLLAGTVHAAPYYGPGPAPFMRGPVMPPPTADPALALRSGVDKLIAFLDTDEPPPTEVLAAFLDSEIAPYFDFEYMAEAAGGRLYESLDEARQQALVASIRRSFLGKMAEKLVAYDRQQIRFLPPRGNSDGRTAQVSAMIVNPGRYPGRLDFRLYRADNQWRVYDVAANGQSAIVHYRRQLMRQEQQRRMQQARGMEPPMRPDRPRGPYGYGPRAPR